MPRNATLRECSGGIAPNQVIALERLLAGDTVTAAAQAAGVSRETVHRWKRYDWQFQAALNQGLNEYQEATRTRLHSVAHRASEIIAQAIERGNLKAAIAVLKGVGVLPGSASPIGPIEPVEVQEEARLASAKREHDRAFRHMLV